MPNLLTSEDDKHEEDNFESEAEAEDFINNDEDRQWATKTIKPYNTRIKIMCWNSRGPKSKEIAAYMEEHEVDIACIQENKIPTNSKYKIKDYVFITSTDIKGGVTKKKEEPKPKAKRKTKAKGT